MQRSAKNGKSIICTVLLSATTAAPCVNTLLGNSCFHCMRCVMQTLRYLTRPVWTRCENANNLVSRATGSWKRRRCIQYSSEFWGKGQGFTRGSVMLAQSANRHLKANVMLKVSATQTLSLMNGFDSCFAGIVFWNGEPVQLA